jgi:hypothetical protein
MDKSYEQRISDIQQGTSQRKARLDKNLAMQTVSSYCYYYCSVVRYVCVCRVVQCAMHGN